MAPSPSLNLHYGSVMDGFTAQLTIDELQSMSISSSITSVFEDSLLHFLTTRTLRLLGLDP
jgi:hypothetical protein